MTLIPVPERLIRILEDRSGGDREPIAVGGTLFALPVPPARLDHRPWDCRIAGNARHRATYGQQDRLSGVLIGEKGLKLRDRKLVDLAGLLGSGHGGLPGCGRILPWN